MSTRSKLAARLAAAVLAIACAAGGVVAAGHVRQSRHAGLAAFAAPAPLVRSAAGGAAAAPARNAKKGVSAWPFPDARGALAKSGASWFYTWAPNHNGMRAPKGVRFVPMMWGAGSVTSQALQQARQSGRVLLGFNEPDMSSQSNMTVAHALSLWPQLMATGLRLGSPAVAYGGDIPGGWLDQFMQGAAARHYRVNFIALHWYGGDFATGAAVSQLKSYLQAVWARYHKPIWLTEFALIRFGPTAVFPSPGQQAAFVTAATTMLEHLPQVWRYAWFALPANATDGSVGLFRPGAIPTVPGLAFEKVDS